MFCQKCGNELPDGSAFCDRCGASTNVMLQQMRQNAPQPPAKKKSMLPVILIIVAAAILVPVIIISVIVYNNFRTAMDMVGELQTAQDTAADMSLDEEEASRSESGLPADYNAEEDFFAGGVDAEKIQALMDTDDEETAKAGTGELSLFGAPVVEEQVIYDGDEARITACDLTVDPDTRNVEVWLDIENKLDEGFTVFGTQALVNGLVTDATVYAEAEAAGTGTGQITLNGYGLELNGIEKIGMIGFPFKALNEDLQVVFDVGLEFPTSLDGSVDQRVPEGGKKLEIISDIGDASQDLIVKYRGFHPKEENLNPFLENNAFVELYVENNSDSNAYFLDIEHGSTMINGERVSGLFGVILAPGWRGVVTMSLFGDLVESLSSSEIYEVSGILTIMEGYEYDDEYKTGIIEFDIDL